MFPSDERVFAHGSENSAGKKKTGNKTGNGVKRSAEGRDLLLLYVFFKTHLRKHETIFLVMYLVTLYYDRATQIYTRRARSSFVSYLQLFENLAASLLSAFGFWFVTIILLYKGFTKLRLPEVQIWAFSTNKKNFFLFIHDRGN